MLLPTRNLISAVLIFGSVLLADVAAADSHTEIKAIVNVNVIPMDINRVIKGQTVVIEGREITVIGAASEVAVPEGSIVIDGEGRYLIPGLAEMHAHVPSQSRGESYRDRVLFLYVANGVTTARGMLGEKSHLTLRRHLYLQQVLGPRLITSGPSFNNDTVDGARDAMQRVRMQKEAGYDFLKLHPGLTKIEFDAVTVMADQLGIRFAGHVSADVGLERALEAKQATIDHLDGYMQALVTDGTDLSAYPPSFFGVNLTSVVDKAKIPALAKATARAGVWNVPTQTLIENIVRPVDAEEMAAWPEMQYMPAEIVRSWVKRKTQTLANDNYDADTARRFVEIRRQLIKALHDSGARLLLGSDAPQVFQVPGFSVHRELEVLVEAGLTPFQALMTGTVYPAIFFERDREFGSIETGKTADLILLNASPLDDIRNTREIEAVMVRGRLLTRADLDEGLDRLSQTP